VAQITSTASQCQPPHTQIVQTQAQHHERKRGAVVEPALPGPAEAQSLAITGRFDLHGSCKYRVGGGEDRAQEDGCARRQTE
jgi:hypothetical protein